VAHDGDIAELSACPACERTPLAWAAEAVRCEGCGTRFPVTGTLPWLFPRPEAMLSEWQGRLRLLLEHLGREASTHRKELERPGLHELTRQRLQRLAAAFEDHRDRLRRLLAPLGLDARTERYEVHVGLGTPLPPAQGLTTYYANVHRDWCWGDEENRASLDAVRDALPALGASARMLVLGAGAGRLAYDLHESARWALTVALDFNPLLATIGQRVAAGEPVELYEFPIAPRTLADHAVLRRLAAPSAARPGLHWVLGDGLAPPFRRGAFEAVVTPWFVDIVTDALPDLMRRINGMLPDGGTWVFFGSLAWADRAPAECYGLEEMLALAGEAGFESVDCRDADMPYMRSPASRHSRVESVITASFRKRSEVALPPPPSALPAWLERDDVPVPALPEFREQALSTRVYAFIMAMIDGERTIRDMAALMEEQRLMPATDAVPAIRRFLARMHADAQRRANF